MSEEVPNLRRTGAFSKLADAIAHRIRGKSPDAEEPKCHCPHHVELRTTVRHHNALVTIALTAALGSLFKSGCDAMAVRVSRVPSQSGSATKLVGTDDTKQP